MLRLRVFTQEMDSLEPINNLLDSALILHARKGDLAQLRTLINELERQINSKNRIVVLAKLLADHRNRLGKTVLHEAAQNNHSDIVKYLLTQVKIDPDCLKQGDWTPLMLAVIKSDLPIIEALIDAGASLSLRNKDGWTPFHLAVREGRIDVLEVMLRRDSTAWNTCSNNRRTPLHTAALHQQSEVVSFLLQVASYTPNKKDSCGITPFMDCIKSGSLGIARELISQHNADPNEHDALGRNAVHIAAEIGQTDSTTFLIEELHFSPNTRTSTGLAPSHFAAKEGHLDLLKLLNSKGADLSCKDAKFGRTSLDLAIIAKQTSVVDYLENFVV